MKKILIFSILAIASAASIMQFATSVEAETVTVQAAVGTLSELRERAVDGQRGFQEAAKHVSSDELRDRFLSISSDHGKLANELQDKIKKIGGQEKMEEGSMAGAAYRTWIDFKGTLAGDKDDKAVLEAVKTGEAKVLEEYRGALKKDLPKDVEDLVQKQTKKIESSYNWTVERINKEKNKQ